MFALRVFSFLAKALRFFTRFRYSIAAAVDIVFANGAPRRVDTGDVDVAQTSTRRAIARLTTYKKTN